MVRRPCRTLGAVPAEAGTIPAAENGANDAPLAVMTSHRLIAISVMSGLALLGGALPANAACGWFGTQLECGLGAGQVVVGTQVAEHPAYGARFRPQPLQGGGALVRDLARLDRRMRLELQDVGADPSLCRRVGNETYCY